MVKSLLNLCLSAVCQHELNSELSFIPVECRQKLLEFFCSHDQVSRQTIRPTVRTSNFQLSASDCSTLVCSKYFGCNIPSLTFYLSAELTDEMLNQLTTNNKYVEKITLVDCPNVTNLGAQAVTTGQILLRQLELRAMHQLTDQCLENVYSPFLYSVDLSGCGKVRGLISRLF